MGKAVTVIIAILGFVATVWNTISVEKKGSDLEDADTLVESMEQELETRELNYRLAVQEFNFSTLHAANAYDIDGNDKLLGASVAPGTTMLREASAGGPSQRMSLRDKAKFRRKNLKMKMKPGPKPPKPDGKTAAKKSQAGRRPTLLARQPVFARIAGPKLPSPTPGGPGKQPPKRSAKTSRKVVGALSDAGKSVRAAVKPAMTNEKRRQLATVRGFQIENLSRWRQYMYSASQGEPMSEEQVARWEDLLSDALIRNEGPAQGRYVGECARAVSVWQDSYQEGRGQLEEESDKKATLKKQVDRGKSIYMGLMLVGLLMVTVKDVFGKSEA